MTISLNNKLLCRKNLHGRYKTDNFASESKLINVIMGTTDKAVVTDDKKKKEAAGSQKEPKRRIKFTRITREELERIRIPVYEYII